MEEPAADRRGRHGEPAHASGWSNRSLRGLRHRANREGPRRPDLLGKFHYFAFQVRGGFWRLGGAACSLREDGGFAGRVRRTPRSRQTSEHHPQRSSEGPGRLRFLTILVTREGAKVPRDDL